MDGVAMEGRGGYKPVRQRVKKRLLAHGIVS